MLGLGKKKKGEVPPKAPLHVEPVSPGKDPDGDTWKVTAENLRRRIAQLERERDEMLMVLKDYSAEKADRIVRKLGAK